MTMSHHSGWFTRKVEGLWFQRKMFIEICVLFVVKLCYFAVVPMFTKAQAARMQFDSYYLPL